MSSLVADYGASSSDSDSETENNENIRYSNPQTKHNLLTSQDTSSSSDSETPPPVSKSSQSRSTSANKDGDEENVASKLPLPFPNVFAESETTKTGEKVTGLSVFANPFEQARQERLTILEKHVKLKEHKTSATSTSKNICFKFQKGKCRFGDTCRFLHPGSTPGNGTEQTGGSDKPVQSASGASVAMGAMHGGQFPPFGMEMEAEEEETVQRKRKDRAGLSANLVPSRKAQRIYDQQRVKDRPWTTKR